jgi:hypothetical protein
MMRLFLADRFAGTLWEDEPRDTEHSTREEYLRSVFTNEVRFKHRKQTYVFTPYPSPSGAILTGVVAREHTITVGRPPEENYQKADVPDWDTANVFIDVSGHDDGQKVAMQDVGSVGAPLSVFRSLADYINRREQLADWLIAVNSITSDKDFWKVVAENQGHITEIDLVFAAPNIWGGVSETEKGLKKLEQKNGIKETEIKLRNSEGNVNPGTSDDGGVIATSIDYINRGGGRYKAKCRRKTIYNSEDNVIKKIPDKDIPIQDAEQHVVIALATWLMSKQ